MIEEDAELSLESKAQMLDMLRDTESAVAAAPLTDPHVLIQARQLSQAMQDLTDRLFARQISGDDYDTQLTALLDGVPPNVKQTASKINRFVAAEMDLSSDKGRS
jgi:hypothetical protein